MTFRRFCQYSLLVSGMCLSTSPMAADIYVSTDGRDTNPGSQSAPVATLERARSLAATFSGSDPVTVHVADGTYYLPETLVFTPADSGSAGAPVVYQADGEAGAVLSGGTPLQLEWQPFRDGIFMAVTEPGLAIDQLFVDGQSQRMARYPNFDAARKTDAYQGFAADAFSRQRAAKWAHPEGGYIHAMHRARWGGYHYRITGKDPDGNVIFEGGWQNNRQMGMHQDFRMVENIFEELDAPGEWFHDKTTHTLYYMPADGVELASATIEVVRLRHLVEFRGSDSVPVKHITLKGFVFRHAARTFMETKEPLLRSDWAIYRGGAVLLTGTENVQILDTEFDQVGGNAIFASNCNRGLRVQGCHIHDCGASGVCFVGDPNAVRNPLFEYREKNDLAEIDRTPGPKTNNYPADSIVEDCLIHGIGRVERQPAGILIEMSKQITVRDCSIYDCARAGINIGDGAWGGHLIEGCDVFDTVQETHDHGSFNSWGRDRFWRSDRDVTQAAVDMEPNLPFLDAVETTVIRNSRWRCDHGWDIDLDDGSSNYDIYNNLLLSGGLKLREGFRRHAWNNITINNGLHPHVWYNNSGDEVYSNIFMAAPQGARMPSHTAKGKRVDGNLYFSENQKMKDRFTQFGWDVNSIVADPEFIDPAQGDFRVAKGSPAFQIGFRNFPMDQFGVKKSSLRAIAETPIIPQLEIQRQLAKPRRDSPQPATEISSYFLGSRVQSLTGETYSAFGVSQEDGGVAISQVGGQTEAAKIGLLEGDLIQNINGRQVKTVADLLQAFSLAGDTELSLQVIRNQQPVTIQASSGSFVLTAQASRADDFTKLAVPDAVSAKIAANQLPSDAPLSTLSDGQLSDGYGPVFANGVVSGLYRMDLGESKPITAITTWSTNKNGNRGAQNFTLYGSNKTEAPGWDVSDRDRVTPLATIDTTSEASRAFQATSLRAREGHHLGTFRWIFWEVSPVTDRGENTAFQEFYVE